MASVRPNAVRVVFASRHAEMSTTVRLLNQMLAHEALSPMDFSGSVHHTACAYFSLASSNRFPMHAVAAGENTFEAGFLDAAGLLETCQTPPVLLIYGDDVLKHPFSKWNAPKAFPNSVAILLGGRRTTQGIPVRFSMLSKYSRQATRSLTRNPSYPSALQFLKWWIRGSNRLNISTNESVWQWER